VAQLEQVSARQAQLVQLQVAQELQLEQLVLLELLTALKMKVRQKELPALALAPKVLQKLVRRVDWLSALDRLRA
jgi:hypothetical protein